MSAHCSTLRAAVWSANNAAQHAAIRATNGAAVKSAECATISPTELPTFLSALSAARIVSHGPAFASTYNTAQRYTQ
jgi:hypothetical protein